ncbi:hypothetical protein D3C83_42600 [compost metagenome]
MDNRAAAVVHDELLAELLAHALRDLPRGAIGEAARREGDDDAHRFVGIGLRPGRNGVAEACNGAQSEDGARETACRVHDSPLLVVAAACDSPEAQTIAGKHHTGKAVR